MPAEPEAKRVQIFRGTETPVWLYYDESCKSLVWETDHLRIIPAGKGMKTASVFFDTVDGWRGLSKERRQELPEFSYLWSPYTALPERVWFTAEGEVGFGFEPTSPGGINWIPVSCEDPKDFADRGRSLLITALLPLAADLKMYPPDAEGNNLDVYAPSPCQSDFHHLLTEAKRLGLRPPTCVHLTAMTPSGGSVTHSGRAEAAVLLELPTPVAEVAIMSSIADYAGKYGYCTFPPSRFGKPGNTKSAPPVHAPAFGEPPRLLPIRYLVGEVALPACEWCWKLCELVRDMDCVGFDDAAQILPVLLLCGGAKERADAMEAMTVFFSKLPAGLKYLSYLRKHLILLHDDAAHHPMNVLEEMKQTVGKLKNKVDECEKAVEDSIAELNAARAQVHKQAVQLREQDVLLREKDVEIQALRTALRALDDVISKGGPSPQQPN
jgi:hypothetical protein